MLSMEHAAWARLASCISVSCVDQSYQTPTAVILCSTCRETRSTLKHQGQGKRNRQTLEGESRETFTQNSTRENVKNVKMVCTRLSSVEPRCQKDRSCLRSTVHRSWGPKGVPKPYPNGSATAGRITVQLFTLALF